MAAAVASAIASRRFQPRQLLHPARMVPLLPACGGHASSGSSGVCLAGSVSSVAAGTRNKVVPIVALPRLLLPCRLHWRGLATTAQEPKLSREASKALGSIKETAQRTAAKVHLTRAQRRNFQGNYRRFKLMGGRDEFHNVDRNRHGRIFEPWHNFEVAGACSEN